MDVLFLKGLIVVLGLVLVVVVLVVLFLFPVKIATSSRRHLNLVALLYKK